MFQAQRLQELTKNLIERLIGYLPENAPGYADMTVHGFLNFAAELRRLDGDARKQAVNRAVERFAPERMVLISGYRSPELNEQLRGRGARVRSAASAPATHGR